MWIFLGPSGCSLVQKSPMATLFLSSMKYNVKGNHADGDKVLQKKSCHEITPAAAKARSAQVLRNSPRAMSLTGYPSTRECPARYLMMPCQSLPDTRHRCRQIRRPAAQSKLRSSAQGCSACFVPRAHYEMQTNRDFTLTRWSLIRVCSCWTNRKSPGVKLRGSVIPIGFKPITF